MSGYKIGHLEVDSPWGNAGGVVKHPEDVEVMARTGVGWIEAGSYTLEPRAGNGANGETVYYHNAATGETFNSLGMPNKGIDVVAREIPKMKEVANAHGKPLVVNVAPVTNDPVREASELVFRALDAKADAVLLNAGCPNVITPSGGRKELLSRNPEALDAVLNGLKHFVNKYRKPLFLRTSPIESPNQLAQITRVIADSGIVRAVFTPNTWPGYKPVDENGEPILEVEGNIGGKSGPATAPDAATQTIRMKAALHKKEISVVSSGGITTGKALKRRLQYFLADAGAGTTFFYESGDWKEDTDRLLREFSS